MNNIDPSATASESGASSSPGFIPLSVPSIQGNEWKYIKECLDTNWVSSVGSYVDRFERAIADYVGADYAIATTNGTAALHIALLVAGIQPDDEVLVSTLSFIAPANAIRYVGAHPVFMDAEPKHWQIDPQKVWDFLEKECKPYNGSLYNKTTGHRVSAILPVHILGHPVNIAPIREAAQHYNLVVIEDAAEGLGAKYQGQAVGTLGDISCFSFNGNKIVTAGGGGAIVTDNETWAKQAKYLTTQAKDDPVEYIHHQVGYNYRLTNLQAAMGVAQLEQLDQYIQIKRNIANTYTEAINSITGISPMPTEADWAFSTFWLYTVLVNQSQYGIDNRQLMHALSQMGVQTRPLWQPLHCNPCHQNALAYYCQQAEHLYRDALSLPCSVGLRASDQRYILQQLSAFAG